MYKDVFLSLIIPVYNEEKRLPGCVRKLERFLVSRPEPIEVLLVLNGCTDGTQDLAVIYQKQYSWLRILNEEKAGKGNAVRRGMLEAVGKYRMFADVDFAMPVENVNRFIPPALSGFDLAIASRVGEGSERRNEPWIRHLSSRIFNYFVQIAVVPGIRDTQCGFKCFTAEAAEKIFSVQCIDGWAFDPEVLFLAKKFGFTITEVPVSVQYEESSKIKLWKAVPQMLSELLRIRKNDRTGVYDR